MQKHLTLPYEGVSPIFATPAVYHGRDSAVLGRATLGKDASLGALSVVRADGHFVKIGDDFRLGARSTVHIAHEVFPCVIGDRVTVGAKACVHACTVGSDVVVDDGCVILDGAVVADGVAFEPGSIVFPGLALEGGFLYAGIPAKPVRRIDRAEIARRAELIRGRADSPADRATGHQIVTGSDIDDSVFIAASASVKGRIVAAKGSSVFFSNELDAGSAVIAIGENTNIQDNTIIRCAGEGFRIGRESTIGHNVLLHDCRIGDHSLIGIGSVVARGTIVGDHVLLAAGARTEEGQALESGFFYTGVPARKRAPLDNAKRELIDSTIWSYCHYAQVFKAAQRALSAADRAPVSGV